MTIKHILLLVGLLVLPQILTENHLSIAAENEKAKPASVEQAKELFNQGKVKESIKVLTELLKSEPQNPQLHYFLGVGYQNMGNVEEAIRYYSKALELKPKYVSALDNLGIVYIKKNQFDLAEKYLTESITEKPTKNPISHYNLALVYAFTGRQDQFAVEYAFLKANFPEYTKLLNQESKSRVSATQVKRPDPVFGPNVAYQFHYLFAYSGPKGWMGTVQATAPDGSRIYALREGIRAVFLKHDPIAPKKDYDFNAEVLVKVHTIPGAAIEEFFKQVYAGVPKERFIEEPHKIDIKGRQFGVAAIKMSKQAGVAKSDYRSKDYAFVDGAELFIFELSTPENEYADNVKAFDESMKQILFQKEIQQNSNSALKEGRVVNISYMLKSGEIRKSQVISETGTQYVVKTKDGKEETINKSDMKNFLLE